MAHTTPRRERGAERSIGRWAGLAAAAVATSLVLAGCGASASPDSSGTPDSIGDVINIGEQQAPNSLDPALADQNPDFIVPAYDPLIYLANDGSLEPALATEWEMSEGNTKLDLTLRTDVTFTDGSDVTPDAVKASLDYARDAGGTNAGFLAGAEVEVTGDDTLSITIPTPNPMFPTTLTQAFGVGAIISPTGLEDPSTLTPANPSQGAGPYIYDPEKSVVGDHYTYTANPDYYDPSRQHFKELTMLVVADTQTAVNAASTGELDVFVGDFSVAAQAKTAGLQVISGDSLWIGVFFYDRDGAISAPLADVRVRQAINHAIDRETIATAVLGEFGNPAQQIFAPDGEGYVEGLDGYDYDPEKAKELLADAGYPDGFTFETITAVFGGFETVAKAVAGQLAEVGITMNITSESEGPTWVGKIASQEFPVGVQGTSTYPPYLECQNVLLATAPPVINPFHSTTDELDGLCADLAAGSAEDQDAIGQQISQWAVDNAWFAPVTYSSRTYFAGENIGGVVINPVNGLANPLDYFLSK